MASNVPQLVTVPAEMVRLAELPYGAVPPFQLVSPDLIEVIRAGAAASRAHAAGRRRARWRDTRLRVFQVRLARREGNRYVSHTVDMTVAFDTPWTDVVANIINCLKDSGVGDDIDGIAISSMPWHPYKRQQHVIDTRPTAPLPAAALPDGAIVFVVPVSYTHLTLPTICSV